MGLLAEACQVAGNQGIDLFSYSNNRLLAGAEYEAQYTQWIGVPYTFYTNADKANQYYISAGYHGRLGNCQDYELLYNHYVVLKHQNAPNVKRFAELLRPEGGNADIFGYGTLTYTLDAKLSPYPPSPPPPVPMDCVATGGVGRVYLKWSPSGAYSTQGYNVSRATTSGGPYTSIFSTTGNTSPVYTDTKVENGTTYYYVVSAINQAGVSADSTEVSATPVAAGALPDGWSDAELGKPTVPGSATYATASHGTFIVAGEGTGIGGKEDGGHFTYKSVHGDFTITARLADKVGKVNKVGIMMRQSLDPNAPALAMTLGEIGGRQARFGTRSSPGGSMTEQFGNDYTGVPVWFRLQRTGNTFTASQSPDGITWFTVGTSTDSMSPNYLIGMVASSASDKGELATAMFENVLTEITPPPPPDAPDDLTATSDGSNINLAWKAKDSGHDGIKIECSSDNENFYEIADLPAGSTRFINTGLTTKPYFYRLRTYNTGGYSPYSSTASATPAADYKQTASK
jgi:regulation of enolase protein 1 (concanavalin A-like superfamily)